MTPGTHCNYQRISLGPLNDSWHEYISANVDWRTVPSRPVRFNPLAEFLTSNLCLARLDKILMILLFSTILALIPLELVELLRW